MSNNFVGTGYVRETSGSTARELFGSTGLQYSNQVPVNYFEDGSTATALTYYGVSYLSGSTTDQKVYTIDAPQKGVEKTLVLYSSYSTAAGDVSPLGSSMKTIVGTESTAYYFIDNSTVLNSDLHYLTFDRPYTCIELVGLSTSKWGIKSVVMASTVASIASTGTGAEVTIATSNSSGVATT